MTLRFSRLPLSRLPLSRLPLSRLPLSRLPLSLALAALLAALLAACATPLTARQAFQTQPDTVRVHGADIAYRVLGHESQGPPLLMVMGYAGTMDVWDPDMVDALAAGRTVVLMDNRGMGFSTTDDAPLTMTRMAEDAAAILDALGMERADVMGWSMGTAVAQELALARPGLVRSLVLYGPTCHPGPVMPVLDEFAGLTPEQFVARLFPEPWAQAHPDIFSRLPAPARPADPAMIGRQYLAIKQWSGAVDRLPGLDVPTLLVVGEADDVTPPSQARRMDALLPHSRLAVLPGGGHWAMYQFPAEMARLALDFLDRPAP